MPLRVEVEDRRRGDSITAEVEVGARLSGEVEHIVVGCAWIGRRRGASKEHVALTQHIDHRNQDILQVLAIDLTVAVSLNDIGDCRFKCAVVCLVLAVLVVN